MFTYVECANRLAKTELCSKRMYLLQYNMYEACPESKDTSRVGW